MGHSRKEQWTLNLRLREYNYLPSPYRKCNSSPIKLPRRDAVDCINKKSSPCPYHKGVERYLISLLENITKKQLCYNHRWKKIMFNLLFLVQYDSTCNWNKYQYLALLWKRKNEEDIYCTQDMRNKFAYLYHRQEVTHERQKHQQWDLCHHQVARWTLKAKAQGPRKTRLKVLPLQPWEDPRVLVRCF